MLGLSRLFIAPSPDADSEMMEGVLVCETNRPVDLMGDRSHTGCGMASCHLRRSDAQRSWARDRITHSSIGDGGLACHFGKKLLNCLEPIDRPAELHSVSRVLDSKVARFRT